MSALSIATATLDDASALVALRTSVANGMTEQFGEGDWSARPTEPLVIKQLRASRVLIARRGADVVGTVRLAAAMPSLFDSSAFTQVENALYVIGLAVAPDARGQGIGRQLMESAKQVARDTLSGALWLDAFEDKAGAGLFYVKCGFREVGKTAHNAIPLIYYEWLVTQHL